MILKETDLDGRVYVCDFSYKKEKVKECKPKKHKLEAEEGNDNKKMKMMSDSRKRKLQDGMMEDRKKNYV